MDFQTQQNTASQSAAGGASASMANQTAAAQHQAALASGAGGGGGSGNLSYMSPYIRQDFLAQEMLISIMPKFELGRIQFLDAKYGPFSPNYPVNVPLWLALFLRETNTCTIRPPPEMAVNFLTGALQFESDQDGQFHPLPFHYFSIVRQILRYAAADIPDAAVVHRLVDELEQRRISKITNNINVLQNAGLTIPAFTLQLTASEWLFVKATLLNVMNDAVELVERTERRLHRAAGAAGGGGGMGGGGGGGQYGFDASQPRGSDYYQSSSGGDTTTSMSRGGLTGGSSTGGGTNMMMMSGGGGGSTTNDDASSSSMYMFGSSDRHSNNNNMMMSSQGSNTATSLFNTTNGGGGDDGTYYSGSSQAQQGSSMSTSTTRRRSLRG